MLAGFAILIIGLIFDFFLFTNSLAVMFVGLGIFMIGYAIVVGILPAMYSKLQPPEERSLAMSYFNSVAALGRISGSLVGGLLFTFAPSQVLTAVMVFFSLICVLLNLVFFRFLIPFVPRAKK